MNAPAVVSTRSVLASLPIMAALAAAGCGSDAALRTDGGIEPEIRPIVSKSGAGPEARPDAGGDLTSLADQAERDVAEFLRRREQATTAADPPVPAAPPSRVVIFDNPPAPAATTAVPDAAQPPLARDPAPDLPAPTSPAAAQPVAPATLDRLLVELRRELYRRGADSDMPLREMLLVAAMSVLSDEPVLDEHAVDALNDLSDEEKALLTRLQAFFHALGQRLDGGAPADEVVAEAVAALRRALDERHLRIGTAVLCTRVVGFGDFDELGRNAEQRYAFLAHREQHVIVYIEVEEFASELNEAGEWVTELDQQLTIYSDSDGIPVWRADWQTAVDRSRQRRRDFFTVQVVTLPTALSVGRYHLKLRLRDERSGAEAEAGIPFEMLADERMVP